MANLEEVSAVVERLKPFRRMFDDLDTAVRYLASLDENYSEKKKAIDDLTKSFSSLTKERDKISKELKAERDGLEAEIGKLREFLGKSRKAGSDEMSRLNDQLESKQKEHGEKMAAIEKEYDTKLADYIARADQAEKRLIEIESRIEARKQEILRI